MSVPVSPCGWLVLGLLVVLCEGFDKRLFLTP